MRSMQKTLRLGLALGLVGLLSACQQVRPPWIEHHPTLEIPVVDRVDDDVLRVRWPESFSTGPVTIFAGASPKRIDHAHPLAQSGTGEVEIQDPDPFTRQYFELVPTAGAKPRIAAERRLPLDGTRNFRDIGGYETVDGRTVSWGRLYRSDDLASLSDEDLRYLKNMDLKLVCDFRGPKSRSAEPNRLPQPDPPESQELPVDVAGVETADMKDRIFRGLLVRSEMERTMIEAYRLFVTENSGQFAAMFERILDEKNLPSVVHCTGGKDRTGFAAAMVLMALGVPKDTVFEDYLRTNVYLKNYVEWIKRLIPFYSLFRTDPEDLLPLLDARREYLESSFTAIAELYGDFDTYLEEGLGVTPAERQQLKATFLD